MSRFMQGVNLEEVPELQAVPDGTMVLEAESWEEKKSLAGNPKAVICCKIVAPEEVAKKVGKYYMQLPLMESTLWRWKDLYKSIGILDKATDGFDPEDVLGHQFGVVVTLGEYQGTPRNNEQKFLPVGAATPELRGKWEDVDAIEAGGGAGAADAGGGAGMFG